MIVFLNSCFQTAVRQTGLPYASSSGTVNVSPQSTVDTVNAVSREELVMLFPDKLR